jgi:hypothetical protein
MTIYRRRHFAVSLSLLSFLVASPLRAQEVEPKEAKNIPFKGIARLHTLSTKTKRYTAKTTYPAFFAKTRLARFANQKIAATEKKYYREWRAETQKTLKDEPSTIVPYDYSSSASLIYYAAAKLISLRFDSYEFSGGAHGMSIIDTRNFGIISGKPKELVLGDLFKAGSNYRQLVETQVLAKLKKDPNAAWVQDGSVKSLVNSQFNNFSIEPDGVRWLFNQYEMGPYAVGQFEIKLSLKELGPNFRRDLLKR